MAVLAFIQLDVVGSLFRSDQYCTLTDFLTYFDRSFAFFSSHSISLSHKLYFSCCIMDFLRSLNVEDVPEQQTRTSRLQEEHPDFDLNLGFDSCCTCGKAAPTVSCEKCRRVKYCTEKCRLEDAECAVDDELALGHTSVICALLALCNDDEAVEEEDGDEVASLGAERKQAAMDRVNSDYESYPATLANVMMESPCFQSSLQQRSKDELTIHIVGASEGSELWGDHPDPNQRRKVLQSYADALAEVAEIFHLSSIVLEFVGPECPHKFIDTTIPLPPVQAKQSSSKLHVKTSPHDYRKTELTPDVIIFFNPGFTCPDYDWEETVASMKNFSIPFLVSTNTELEAIADLQYLWDRGLIQDIPAGLLGMLDGNDDHEDQEEEEDKEGNAFLGINPYCGLRVRQNGTMANDVYVKSRWIFGGILGSPDALQKKKKDVPPKKKIKTTAGSGSSKRSNPALV